MNDMKTYTLDDIRRMLAKLYDNQENGDSINRPMLVHKVRCDYGSVGCVFFALNGSPPKGYALYVPDHHYLLLVDAWGKTRRITCTNRCYGIFVSGWEELPDVSELPGKKRVV